MKYIVDISKELFEEIKNDEVCGLNELTRAITKGIPLEDITKDIEQTAIEEQTEDSKWALGLRYSLKIIDKHTRKENKQ